MSSSYFFTIFFLIAYSSIVRATVPASQTFKLVNEGFIDDYPNEYGATYRGLRIAVYPNFLLCFYNTTPGAYTLALRLGYELDLMRWVWEANRGNPVGENATFSLGTNGNLVLANADGRVAWQSNTANKGVVGFKLLSNGNMVLYDSKGNFVWQSFDFPTDTLLVGQSLKIGGPKKLLSRLSEKENKDGPYSLVLEPNRFAMYYKSKNSPTSMMYFDSTDYLQTGKILNFTCEPETNPTGVVYTYKIMLLDENSSGRILTKIKYESTLSYLRLSIDGNLRVYTYYNKELDDSSWGETFTLFTRESGEDECQLPERCGNFGLCEDSQCVACPLPKGVMGWSKKCKPPKLPSCKGKDVNYYKLEGVDHFITKYTKGDGPIAEAKCSNKCTKDCKCLGYFYHQADSRCWIVYDLKTLTRVANSTHLGYIKAPIDK